MRRERNPSILIVATLLLGVLFVAGCEDAEDNPWGNPQVRSESAETATFAAGGVLVIDLASTNGTLQVVGVDGATEVVVTATLRTRGRTQEEADERRERITYSVQQLGERIEARYVGSQQEDDVRRFSGVDFEITAPADVRVLAESSNGAISVETIRGNVTADTSNGAVDLYDVTGNVLAESSNGRLAFVRMQGTIHGHTSNGEVWLEAVEGPVDAETSNGGIYYLGIPSGVENRLRTSNGSITVRVPADAAIRFTASTSQGSVRTTLPLVGDTEGDDWDAALNPPAEISVALRTSNGSIRIDAQ